MKINPSFTGSVIIKGNDETDAAKKLRDVYFNTSKDVAGTWSGDQYTFLSTHEETQNVDKADADMLNKAKESGLPFVFFSKLDEKNQMDKDLVKKIFSWVTER